MPDLVLMRHGKSDWGVSTVNDRNRPLAARGIKAAQTMGRALTAVHRTPELIMTSPAIRANTTAEIAAEAGGWTCPIWVIDDFYGGGVGDAIAALRKAPDVERIVAIGHQPTWSSLTNSIIGGGDVAFPTAAVVSLGVPDWQRLGPKTGQLRWMLAPRLFTDYDLSV